MNSVIGINTPNFTLIASDRHVSSSILIIQDQNRISTIDNTIISYSGPQGHAIRMLDYTRESIILHSLRHSLNPSPFVIANQLQTLIHEDLRKEMHQVEFLIGGGNTEYELYMVDIYGALCKDNFFCIGTVKNFAYGELSKSYSKNMSIDDALLLVENIGKVLKKRCIVSFDKFDVRIVNDQGVSDKEVFIN